MIMASANIIARDDSQSWGLDMIYAIFSPVLIFILNYNIKPQT